MSRQSTENKPSNTTKPVKECSWQLHILSISMAVTINIDDSTLTQMTETFVKIIIEYTTKAMIWVNKIPVPMHVTIIIAKCWLIFGVWFTWPHLQKLQMW